MNTKKCASSLGIKIEYFECITYVVQLMTIQHVVLILAGLPKVTPSKKLIYFHTLIFSTNGKFIIVIGVNFYTNKDLFLTHRNPILFGIFKNQQQNISKMDEFISKVKIIELWKLAKTL